MKEDYNLFQLNYSPLPTGFQLHRSIFNKIQGKSLPERRNHCYSLFTLFPKLFKVTQKRLFRSIEDIFMVSSLEKKESWSPWWDFWCLQKWLTSAVDLLKRSLSNATTVYDPGRTLFDQSRVEHLSHLVRHSTAETYSWVEQHFSG